MSTKKAAGAIRSLVKAWGLQLEYGRVLQKELLVAIIWYGSGTMVWKTKNFLIRGVQMDNPRSLLAIRKIERM